MTIRDAYNAASSEEPENLTSHHKEPIWEVRSLDPVYLMQEINDWAGDDHEKWESLLDIANGNYSAAIQLTPGAILQAWVGNKYRHYRGLKDNNEADISFFGRVVRKVEPDVPEAIAGDRKMTDAFMRKVRQKVRVPDGQSDQARLL